MTSTEIITNLLAQSKATLPRVQVAIQDKQSELAELQQQEKQILADIAGLESALDEGK